MILRMSEAVRAQIDLGIVRDAPPTEKRRSFSPLEPVDHPLPLSAPHHRFRCIDDDLGGECPGCAWRADS